MANKMFQLHKGEEIVRGESLRRIGQFPSLSAHLKIIESSMDAIVALLPSNEVRDADILTFGNLGIRLFNAIAVSSKLFLAGYYQASALQIRDLVETTFLIDYLSSNSALMGRWRTAPERERMNQFGQAKIRIALDSRDGFTEKKREKAYKLLSGLAGHATPEGFVMLKPDPKGSFVHFGPFLENTALEALLVESAKNAVLATEVFQSAMIAKCPEASDSCLEFSLMKANWIKHHFSPIPNEPNP